MIVVALEYKHPSVEITVDCIGIQIKYVRTVVMERLQRLARSLKTARTVELPEDDESASHVLCPMIMQNHYKTVTELLSSSSYNVNHMFGRARRCLLHIAANVGAYECLVLLLKRKADVNCQDISGVTPLQLAARNGKGKCIQKLLEFKADIHLSNKEGMTAIHWLASNGRTELLGELLQHKSDVDIEDSQGQTALHVACLNGHTVTVSYLLEKRADIENQDYKGCTPLFFACRHGHVDCVRVLLLRGATLVTNHDRVSPLEICVKGGYEEVCHLLIETFPHLLAPLLKLIQHQDYEEMKMFKILRFLCEANGALHVRILTNLGELATQAGLLLLSISSNYEDSVAHFLRIIHILCKLYTKPDDQPRNRMDSCSSVSSRRSRVDSASNMFKAAFGTRPSSSGSGSPSSESEGIRMQ